ncbi:MAG: hypothetical protein IKC40_03995 [Oscillospiraceae bacterium]|nr:hypothetical protein [Oscillospiraceae bacterium]
MKKTLGTLLAILFCFMSPLAAAAEESAVYSAADNSQESVVLSDTEELWLQWAKFAPDYICGIWSTDGSMERLTIGIQDTEEGNAAKQEILDMIEDDSAITFVYQKHSKNELLRILDELYPYFERNAGLVSAGLNEIDNRIDIEIFEKNAKDAATKEMISELENAYGDAISISYTDEEIILTTGGEIGADTPKNHLPLYLTAGGMAILVSAFLFIRHRQNTAAVLQTNAGSTVSVSPSSAKVGDMIRHTEPDFPSELDARILDAAKHEE